MKTIRAPFAMFGVTRNIPVVTYTNGKLDNPPKTSWDKEMWIEREEDWYGLPRKGTVRVVTRQKWMYWKLEPYNNIDNF